MTVPESPPPRRFYHGRAIALVLGLALFSVAIVDLIYDHRLSMSTLYKAVFAAALFLGWFYLFRFPKLRRR